MAADHVGLGAIAVALVMRRSQWQHTIQACCVSIASWVGLVTLRTRCHWQVQFGLLKLWRVLDVLAHHCSAASAGSLIASLAVGTQHRTVLVAMQGHSVR